MADYQDVSQHTMCFRCHRLIEDRYIYLTDTEPCCVHCLSVEEGLKFSEEKEMKVGDKVMIINMDTWETMLTYARCVRNPTVSVSKDMKGQIDNLLLMESKFWADKLAASVLEIGGAA